MNKLLQIFSRPSPMHHSHVEGRYSESAAAFEGPRSHSIREHEVRQSSVDDPSVGFAHGDRIGHTNGRYVSEGEDHRGHEKDTVKELYQMAEVLREAEFRCREMIAIAERDANKSRDKIETLEREVQSVQFQFHTKIKELETEHRHYGELVESTRRHGEQIQAAKEELRIAEAHHVQTRHLLEERTTELAGAQRFLTQTDSLSGADAIALAESLNAEILQAAAYMADSLEFSYRQPPSNIAASEKKNRRVSYILGEPIMQVLRSRLGQDATDLDPTPVQIALQVAMVCCSTKIIELWVQDDKGHETLTNIFSRIAEKEEQAVSGRWRSMTRAHATRTWNKISSFAMECVVNDLANVLTIAGWAQQDRQAETLFRIFRERLSRMVDLILRLRRGIGEDITSAHIYAKTIRAGETFDSRIMDDTYADDRRNTGQVRGVFSPNSSTSASSGEKAAGTTEIGLMRFVKGHQPVMLLKPKVVLCSAL